MVPISFRHPSLSISLEAAMASMEENLLQTSHTPITIDEIIECFEFCMAENPVLRQSPYYINPLKSLQGRCRNFIDAAFVATTISCLAVPLVFYQIYCHAVPKETKKADGGILQRKSFKEFVKDFIQICESFKKKPEVEKPD